MATFSGLIAAAIAHASASRNGLNPSPIWHDAASGLYGYTYSRP